MFLLDTNSLIFFFRGEGRVAQRLLATAPAEVALPAIVVYELEVGVAASKAPERRRRQLGQLLELVAVVPFGRREARSAAEVRASLEAAGRPIGPLDTLIAATALAHRATLVTHNRRELTRVPGLRLDDWY